MVIRDTDKAAEQFAQASLGLARGSILEIFNQKLAVNSMMVDGSAGMVVQSLFF